MPSGNSPSIQEEMDAKLRQARALIGDAINLAAQLRAPAKGPGKPAVHAARANTSTSVRFDMNERAFVKRHVKPLSGGPKKFVLLLAFLTKGDTDKEMELSEIERLWNKTSSKTLLGMKFNRFFPTTAKENGWVNSRKRGFYQLERSWKDVLTDD